MEDDVRRMQASVLEGIPAELPPHPGIDSTVDHAKHRRQLLTPTEKRLAIRNALRYIPTQHHQCARPRVFEELNTYGRILMRRYRPTSFPMKAYPIDTYPTKSRHAASIMLMIHNNPRPCRCAISARTHHLRRQRVRFPELGAISFGDEIPL